MGEWCILDDCQVESLTSFCFSEGYCEVAFYWWSPSSCWGWKTRTYINGMLSFEFALQALTSSLCAPSSICFSTPLSFIECRKRRPVETVWCLRCFLLHRLILSLYAYILLTIAVNSWQTKSELKLRSRSIPSTGLCSKLYIKFTLCFDEQLFNTIGYWLVVSLD